VPFGRMNSLTIFWRSVEIQNVDMNIYT
jgi:hypothetical protein